MEEEKKEKKSNRPIITAIIVFFAILAVMGVVWWIVESGVGGASSSNSSSSNSTSSKTTSARYVGSNKNYEIDITLKSNSSFTFTISDFGTGITKTLKGTYEFLGSEGKVVKFTFEDGSSTRCSRSIGSGYEFLSISEINYAYPAVYRK